MRTVSAVFAVRHFASLVELPAVFHGSETGFPLEALDEVALGGKAVVRPDFRQGYFRGSQKLGSGLKLGGEQVLVQRFSDLTAEKCGEIAAVQRDGIGDVLRGQLLVEMSGNVGDRLGNMDGIGVGTAHLLHAPGKIPNHGVVQRRDLGNCGQAVHALDQNVAQRIGGFPFHALLYADTCDKSYRHHKVIA